MHNQRDPRVATISNTRARGNAVNIISLALHTFILCTYSRETSQRLTKLISRNYRYTGTEAFVKEPK